MSRKRNKKNQQAVVKLEKYAAEGKSVGKLEDDKTIFVTGAVPGDTVNVRIRKHKSSYAEGVAMEIVTPSADRVSPFCEHFGICGGCKWQMLPYEKQLEYKQQQVIDQITRLGKIDNPPMLPIIGSSEDKYYRNKLEFTFNALPYLTNEQIAAGETIDQHPVLGFHAPGFFDKVVDIHTCYLMEDMVNKLRNDIRDFTLDKGWTYYNPRTQEGWLRNIIFRKSTLGEWMVNVIVKSDEPALYELLSWMKDSFDCITSLHYTINGKVNDAIYDLPVITYHGKGYIEEKLEDFTFKISPKSFFQTNTKQAEVLYRVVRDFAGLTGQETIYDLYCGTGSIGIFLSSKAGKIIGVETVADAIEDAKINAALNGLENTHFIAGDVIKIIDDNFYDTYGRPDVVITDPPRAGMHDKMIEQLLKIAAPRVVYVSCNPATQARDLQLLSAKYTVRKIQPVDMFPHTHHIESVALLELIQDQGYGV